VVEDPGFEEIQVRQVLEETMVLRWESVVPGAE